MLIFHRKKCLYKTFRCVFDSVEREGRRQFEACWRTAPLATGFSVQSPPSKLWNEVQRIASTPIFSGSMIARKPLYSHYYHHQHQHQHQQYFQLAAGLGKRNWFSRNRKNRF